MTPFRAATRRGWTVLQVAGSIGLAAGLVEVAVLALRRWGLDHFVWTGRQFPWMTPASYLAFYLALAGVPALLYAWRPWRWLVPATAAALSWLGVVALLRLISLQRLHIVAIAVFGAGVAVQVARLFARHPEGAVRWMRRVLPGLAAAWVVVGGASALGPFLAERAALRRLRAAPDGAPNVLVLILDTVRAASLGLYGYGRPTTPGLERIARRGVVFDRAFSTAPWTLQSHASFFTGRLPHELSPDFLTPLDAAYPTLAEAFRDRGYLTAGFVANHYYCGWESGIARGFAHYEDYRVSLRQMLLSSELGQMLSDYRSKLILRTNHGSPAPVINGMFLDWLSRTDRRPFFAFLNYMDAHEPYRTPWEVERQFRSGEPKVDQYDAAIAYLDAALDSLFQVLDARGILENTVVIVTSDHGEQLGEHGLDNHGNSLYLPLLHVPLVVLAPGDGAPAGLRVTAPVSLLDLPVTALRLAGIPDGPFTGRSLARFWGPDSTPDPVLVAEVARHPTGLSIWPNRQGPMWSVFVGSYHYIRRGDGGPEELYDYQRDPAELQNLATTPAGATPLGVLRGMLDSVLVTVPQP